MRRPDAAMPVAVETTPSIPLAPRLAITGGGDGNAGANHSRSRMGMDADTMMVAPDRGGVTGEDPGHRGLAEAVSERPLDGRLSRRLVGPPLGHSHAGSVDVGRIEGGGDPARRRSHGGTRSPRGRGRSTATTGRPRSPAHRGPPRAATYSPRALESHVPPSSTTVSGSAGCVRTMASAAATVPGSRHPDRGSARTGHPSRSPNAQEPARVARCSRAGDDQPAATQSAASSGARSTGQGRTTTGPRGSGSGAGLADEGLPEGEVEVYRPGTERSAPGLGHRPLRQRPPRSGL